MESTGIGKTDIKYTRKNVYFRIKRVVDFIVSLCGIIVLLPIFLMIIIIIKVDSKGAVFYKHTRIGKHGKPFEVYKFRSMTTTYQNFEEFYNSLSDEQKQEWNENYKLKSDPRITRFGNFLRKSSLDELPQIFNILKGEMSIIGPRPIVEKELEFYGNRKEELLSVLPGLTGYWAANGRSSTSYKERIEMELYYVENCGISLDIQIFFQTIIKVLKKDGAL